MFWNVRAIPAEMTRVFGTASSRSPPRRIDPPLMSQKRVMQLKSVVLPAPLGPIRPQTSPLLDREARRRRAR